MKRHGGLTRSRGVNLPDIGMGPSYPDSRGSRVSTDLLGGREYKDPEWGPPMQRTASRSQNVPV